jgi:hypothetical protein
MRRFALVAVLVLAACHPSSPSPSGDDIMSVSGVSRVECDDMGGKYIEALRVCVDVDY